jgi:hypothetical protein
MADVEDRDMELAIWKKGLVDLIWGWEKFCFYVFLFVGS